MSNARIQIKFGKIERDEPLSIGGDGVMDILARAGSGDWVKIGYVEVGATRTHEGVWPSEDRYAVNSFDAYLDAWLHVDDAPSVECFGYAAVKLYRSRHHAVTRWSGSAAARIRTAAEARRILRAKIAEALVR